MELGAMDGIKLVVGHYGSGKTEFSINYSISRAKMGKRVLLGDLDIVNPYFRARDQKEFLGQKGITVLSSALADGFFADIPSLSPQLFSMFVSSPLEKVMDVGGDPAGARVLSRFYQHISPKPYEMWMVVNANRPETQTPEQVIRYMHAIEQSSRLTITAVINNTHLKRETGMQDIVKGNELCRQVKERTGIPVKYVCFSKTLSDQLPKELDGEHFPLDLYLATGWS